jgi:toxin ParE1/3/4
MAEIKIIWSKGALKDIEEIISFISKDSTQYATRFASKIIDSIEVLKTFPEIGRIVPEYDNKNLREIIYRNYRIVYKTSEGIAEIVTIFQGSKQLE